MSSTEHFEDDTYRELPREAHSPTVGLPSKPVHGAAVFLPDEYLTLTQYLKRPVASDAPSELLNNPSEQPKEELDG